MNLKHTAMVRQVLQTSDTGRIIEERVQPVAEFRDFTTLWSLMYNQLGMSGGTRWVHPTTGEWFQKGLSTKISIVDPSDILKDGELCYCEKCLA